ncbi:MAG: hypothetical protein ACR2QF_07820, partial [Geminicoccaceae bacterium]
RLVKRNLPILIAQYGFSSVYSDIIIPNDAGMKWMLRLGFEPVRVLENAYGHGHDHLLFRLDVT